jgi:hypothetical protein
MLFDLIGGLVGDNLFQIVMSFDDNFGGWSLVSVLNFKPYQSVFNLRGKIGPTNELEIMRPIHIVELAI